MLLGESVLMLLHSIDPSARLKIRGRVCFLAHYGAGEVYSRIVCLRRLRLAFVPLGSRPKIRPVGRDDLMAQQASGAWCSVQDSPGMSFLSLR